MRQPANGEDLVGANAGVAPAGLVIDVDDVVQAAGRGVPEAILKCRPSTLRNRAVAAAGAAQRVDPQRLHFDWLADAWRHHVVAELGVHPRQLHTGHAAGEEPVAVHVNAVAGAGRVAVEDGVNGIQQAVANARPRTRCLRNSCTAMTYQSDASTALYSGTWP